MGWKLVRSCFASHMHKALLGVVFYARYRRLGLPTLSSRDPNIYILPDFVVLAHA